MRASFLPTGTEKGVETSAVSPPKIYDFSGTPISETGLSVLFVRDARRAKGRELVSLFFLREQKQGIMAGAEKGCSNEAQRKKPTGAYSLYVTVGF